MLQRGQEISKRDWKVLRVAITELRDSTYIGRLFFGDADTGNLVWDCDCRPSDGCWLALKVMLLAFCTVRQNADFAALCLIICGYL